jgi:hypothetical protein
MTRINEARLKALSGLKVKFEALDVVLNTFDFSSRAQQRDGPSEDFLLLKPLTQVLVLSEDDRTLNNGVIVDFVTPTDTENTTFAKKISCDIPQIETSVKEWLTKNPLLPRVKNLKTGDIKIVHCRVWVIRANGRAVAWRVQLPIRHAYAISLPKSQKMVIENIKVACIF